MAVSQERDDTMMINERSVNYSKGRRVHKWSLWRSARYAEARDTRDQEPRDDATLHNPRGDNGHVTGRQLPSRHVKRVHCCSHGLVQLHFPYK